MPDSKIYPFAPTDTGTNLLSDAAYLADAHRVTGNQPGIARGQLVNKALRQSSLIAAAVAKFIAETKGVDITDALSDATIASYMHSAILNMIGGIAPPAGYETPGLVAYFPRTTPPLNWLRCNGVAISRVTYANLFAAIGTAFGVGDGSTTFNLPDLRGEFIRSWDDGRGVDAGRAMGAWQKASIFATDLIGTGVAVDVIRGTAASTGGDPVAAGNYAGSTTTWLPTSNQVDAFSAGVLTQGSRPRNIAMLACIKY